MEPPVGAGDGPLLLLAAGVAFALLVLAEGRRQSRKHGRASGRPGLAGAGMLELQRHLQPDRKVEVLRRQHGEEPGEVEVDRAGGPPGPRPSALRGPRASGARR